MPVNPTYPGLYIEEVPSSARTITPAPTSVTVFVGYTHPFEGTHAQDYARTGDWSAKPVQIFSFTDYERVFGGLFRSNHLHHQVPYAVREFFLNGGTEAYVVALQPMYFDPSGTNPPAPIEGKSGSISGIEFTARRITYNDNPVTVTIVNLRTVDATDDLADIVITYGSETPEVYRGVRTKAGVVSELTDPNHANYLRDHVANRLRDSQLVDIDAAAGGYLDAYNRAELSLDLGDMNLPSYPWVPDRVQDFLDVFAEESELDKVDVINILTIPGNSDPTVLSTALAFSERKRAIFIMDPPHDRHADESPMIQDYADSTSLPKSTNGALYFPYLKTSDPLTGQPMELPPSSFVAGTYARIDLSRGVWKAPAGLETTLRDTTGVVESGRMTNMRQGELNERGINALRDLPGSGTVIWGARTLTTQNPSFQQWRYIPVRRMALFLEQTLLANLGWVVFEPNDEPLWSAIRISIGDFMLSLFKQGAFQGRRPSQAFRVRCDETTTTQTDIDRGIVNIEVAFRPLKPAEFVIIKISQLAGQAQA